MANDLEFTTAKRRAKPIKFTLDGEEYTFTPPKNAVAVMPVVHTDGDQEVAAVRGQFDWLDEGLPKEQSERLEARIRDPKDDLDIENLQAIIKGLMKKVAGRPTT